MRLRGQRGQTSAEYLGMLVVIAGLVSALTAGGIGATIAHHIEAAVCRIVRPGDACPTDPARPTAAPAAAASKPPCTTSIYDHESSFSTDLLFNRQVDGSRYYLERLSDGTVVVL